MEALIKFDWSYFFSLFGNSTLWHAAWITVSLTTLSWGVAALLGIPLALAEQSRFIPLWAAAKAYVWVFRAIPQLLMIIFVYNAVPEAVPGLASFLGDPFRAGAVALIVSEAAYMAEVFRGSLLAVSDAQRDAGRALGLPYLSLQRLVVLPQAVRIAIPPLGNEYVATLKNTSLVSVISLVELTLAGQRIYSQNFLIIETLACVAVFYLAIASIFTILQHLLERRLNVSRRTGGDDGSFLRRMRNQVLAPRSAAI